jgi:GAF domain-containing protein
MTTPPPRNIDAFSAVLLSEGPAAALAYLNTGVPHRYTAVYRFDDNLLRNVLLHDKRDELRPQFLLAVPFEHSFCQFVRKDQSFRTDDSGRDQRLEGHPYRGVVVSYHSVPLSNDFGELWGTLSHFDMVRQPMSDEEFDLLERAARILGSHLDKPITET